MLSLTSYIISEGVDYYWSKCIAYLFVDYVERDMNYVLHEDEKRLKKGIHFSKGEQDAIDKVLGLGGWTFFYKWALTNLSIVYITS